MSVVRSNWLSVHSSLWLSKELMDPWDKWLLAVCILEACAFSQTFDMCTVTWLFSSPITLKMSLFSSPSLPSNPYHPSAIQLFPLFALHFSQQRYSSFCGLYLSLFFGWIFFLPLVGTVSLLQFIHQQTWSFPNFATCKILVSHWMFLIRTVVEVRLSHPEPAACHAPFLSPYP